jgi:GNAT superfamily N-acetyltransferase
MIPVSPAITLHSLENAAAEALARFIGPRLVATPYSAPVDTAMVQREVLADAPPVVFPVRWQRHHRLGAWRAGRLVGFLDAAIGLDSESLDRPDYQPLGLIRFLALPERAELAPEVATALLDAAQLFWQEAGVAHVKAFHLSTGYPSFQAGAGLLPGDWGEQVRALTGAGFHLRERFYCLYRPLAEPHEEVTPAADLSLVYRGGPRDRRYELYYRRIDWVGRARLVHTRAAAKDAEDATDCLPIAYLPDLYIDPKWRRQDIGKWLLRRLINDATLQGDAQMVVHLAQHHHAAMNLFVQQGFQELSYRGYSLEKALTR